MNKLWKFFAGVKTQNTISENSNNNLNRETKASFVIEIDDSNTKKTVDGLQQPQNENMTLKDKLFLNTSPDESTVRESLKTDVNTMDSQNEVCGILGETIKDISQGNLASMDEIKEVINVNNEDNRTEPIEPLKFEILTLDIQDLVQNYISSGENNAKLSFQLNNMTNYNQNEVNNLALNYGRQNAYQISKQHDFNDSDNVDITYENEELKNNYSKENTDDSKDSDQRNEQKNTESFSLDQADALYDKLNVISISSEDSQSYDEDEHVNDKNNEPLGFVEQPQNENMTLKDELFLNTSPDDSTVRESLMKTDVNTMDSQIEVGGILGATIKDISQGNPASMDEIKEVINVNNEDDRTEPIERFKFEVPILDIQDLDQANVLYDKFNVISISSEDSQPYDEDEDVNDKNKEPESSNKLNEKIFEYTISDSECGYLSSDFEFITEDDAKKDGLIINYKTNKAEKKVTKPKKYKIIKVATDTFSKTNTVEPTGYCEINEYTSAVSSTDYLNTMPKDQDVAETIYAQGNIQNDPGTSSMQKGVKRNNVSKSLKIVKKPRTGINGTNPVTNTGNIHSPDSASQSNITHMHDNIREVPILNKMIDNVTVKAQASLENNVRDRHGPPIQIDCTCADHTQDVIELQEVPLNTCSSPGVNKLISESVPIQGDLTGVRNSPIMNNEETLQNDDLCLNYIDHATSQQENCSEKDKLSSESINLQNCSLSPIFSHSLEDNIDIDRFSLDSTDMLENSLKMNSFSLDSSHLEDRSPTSSILLLEDSILVKSSSPRSSNMDICSPVSNFVSEINNLPESNDECISYGPDTSNLHVNSPRMDRYDYTDNSKGHLVVLEKVVPGLDSHENYIEEHRFGNDTNYLQGEHNDSNSIDFKLSDLRRGLSNFRPGTSNSRNNSGLRNFRHVTRRLQRSNVEQSSFKPVRSKLQTKNPRDCSLIPVKGNLQGNNTELSSFRPVTTSYQGYNPDFNKFDAVSSHLHRPQPGTSPSQADYSGTSHFNRANYPDVGNSGPGSNNIPGGHPGISNYGTEITRLEGDSLRSNNFDNEPGVNFLDDISRTATFQEHNNLGMNSFAPGTSNSQHCTQSNVQTSIVSDPTLEWWREYRRRTRLNRQQFMVDFSYRQNHRILDGEEYYNLFDMNNGPLPSHRTRQENKSTPSLDHGRMDYQGIGFDMRQLREWGESENEEEEEEANRSVRKILDMYPDENTRY